MRLLIFLGLIYLCYRVLKSWTLPSASTSKTFAGKAAGEIDARPALLDAEPAAVESEPGEMERVGHGSGVPVGEVEARIGPGKDVDRGLPAQRDAGQTDRCAGLVAG